MNTKFENIRKRSMNMMMKLLGAAFLILQSSFFISCDDMIEVGSDRQIFDPKLDTRIDSIFFTLGIMKSIQQCGDQLVLVNELRGDLAGINEFTETPLRELYNFSATESNKYDSAYVYYRVINNCNYYIAHRDTTLRSGSREVAMAEYVQAKVVRAWTYLQLAKLYGSVPFYTDPITGINDANDVSERRDVKGIYDAFIDDLEYYCNSYYAVPNYANIDKGPAAGAVPSQKIMFPIHLVAADLCLEAGNYARAAHHYFEYLRKTQTVASPYLAFSALNFQEIAERCQEYNINTNMRGTMWANSWAMGQWITLVPYASSSTYGVVTDLPRIFGYNMYEVEATSQYLKERQIVCSKPYIDMADSQEYFYTRYNPGGGEEAQQVTAAPIGDWRRFAQQQEWADYSTDSVYRFIRKFNSGNIGIYRPTMVYLRLAEAINRMGHPDAAFMILKDGINRETLVTDTINYKPETTTLFYEKIPFLSEQNYQVMTNFNNQQANVAGIHSYGSGVTAGMRSPYSLSYVVGRKFDEIGQRTGLVMDSLSCTINDTINAMEDIICDEMALELAFEGCRYTDLCRMARHKNENSPARYGANYGSLWLRDKLAFKQPVVDLSDPQQWYLKSFFNR